MSETYTVVLLVEQALTAADAAQIRSLHEGLDDEVRYHVLFPAEDAAARVEAAIGTLGSDAITGAPSIPPDPETTSRWSARRPSARPAVTSRRRSRRSTVPAPRPTGEVVDERPDRGARRHRRRRSTDARRSS